MTWRYLFIHLVFVSSLAGCHSTQSSESSSDIAIAEACKEIGDLDRDGVCDDRDNCLIVPNPDQADIDGDAVGNACDPSEASPCAGLGGDADGDDVCQSFDNCPDDPNADQRDADDDGLGDVCDEEISSCVNYGGDMDSDSICNAFDNCVNDPNPDQVDGDGDHLGDACDPFFGNDVCDGKGGDADTDDVCQAIDNCPDVPNAAQTDADGDGLGDDCDATPNPCDDLGGDEDSDTICNALDNCPDVSNITQFDADMDGIGDVCDPVVPVDPSDPPCAGLGGDHDSDDWCGIHDNCPSDHNPDQLDNDDDGLGNACDQEACDGIDNDGDGQTDEDFPNTDGDEQADCLDPCPEEVNADFDADGIPDCGDPCPADPNNDEDNDGLCAENDNCPEVANNSGSSAQRDLDGDGIGDRCDVEECDGLDNDGDGSTDEQMPDEDEDGICDTIDSCLNDSSNDADNDGICGLSDNCPSVNNANQLDSDSDGWGDLCDIDAPAACSGSAAVNPAGTVPLPADLLLQDIVYDETRNLLYGTIPSSVPVYGNGVVAIEPITGTLIWHLWIGSEPNKLGLSDDASILYVSIDGANSIRMVNLEQRKACLQFSLRQHPANTTTTYEAHKIAVIPGSPETILVIRKYGNHYYDLDVYDRGGARNYKLPSTWLYGRDIFDVAFDGAGQIYASVDDRGIRTLSFGLDAVIEGEQLFAFEPTSFKIWNDLIYTSYGRILDPAQPTVLAGMPASGVFDIHPSTGDIYFLSRTSSNGWDPFVQVYDGSTYLMLGEYTVSTLSSDYPQRIVWCGADRFAVLTTKTFEILEDILGGP